MVPFNPQWFTKAFKTKLQCMGMFVYIVEEGKHRICIVRHFALRVISSKTLALLGYLDN